MWSWNLGRLFGIDIGVHASFLLLLAWVVMSSAGAGIAAVALGLAFVVAMFASVVAHELGHALTARAFGIDTRQILLLPIGGVAQLEQNGRMGSRAELLIALAGPVVSFLLAGVLFTFGALTGDVTPGSFLGLLAWANLGIALFNMMPAFPMDGGRVLRAALARRLGHDRATSIAATIGTWAAVALGIYAVLAGKLMLGLVALFLYFSARGESQHLPPWRPFSGLGGRGRPGPSGGFFGGRTAREAGPTRRATSAPTRRPVVILRDPGPTARVAAPPRAPTIVRDRHGRTWLVSNDNHWN